MELQLLSVAAVTALIMISPGPDLALVARNTVVGGKHAGGWTSAGILCGNLLHITYCALGVGWLIANSIVLFSALKIAGGLYLIFLGVQSLRATQVINEPDEQAVPPRGRWWIQGFVNNLLNPKGALFYLGLFSVFATADSSALDLALIIATTIGVSAAFWVLFVYVLQVSSVRGQLQRFGLYINRVLGLLLISLGVRLWFAELPED